jgi:hypothetical protein
MGSIPMTIQQKGSRRIQIDGVQYRWAIRDRPTYMQAIGQSNLSVAVEQVDAPHCILRLVLPAVRRDNWLLQVGYVVLPSDLSRWIPKALRAGWHPHQRGAGFEFRLSDADLNDKQRIGEGFNRLHPGA